MNLSHLKQLLIKHGITQTDLARILGRDKSVVTNLFQGRRQLKADEAAAIARLIGVPVAHILGIREHSGRQLMEPPLLIPFQHEPQQSKKRAGIVKKEDKFYLEVEASADYSAKAYALEVRDDSMNLIGILPGDIIISEMERPCKTGQIVVAQHYQGRGAKTIIRQYDPPFLLPRSMTQTFKPLNLEDGHARLVSPVVKLIRTF
jgi:transcriptional regulator with XRE-family HTH domain